MDVYIFNSYHTNWVKVKIFNVFIHKSSKNNTEYIILWKFGHELLLRGEEKLHFSYKLIITTYNY